MMDTEDKTVDRILLGVALVALILMFCSVCRLSISVVSADELPPLLLEYYIPIVYNELPVFPPCPTPVPGEPIVC